MATLNTNDKQVLEKLFKMGGGYVLNFSDRTMKEFFADDIGIDIYDEKFKYASGSKANCIRGFWQVAEDLAAGKSIAKLIEYIENQILIGNLSQADYPNNLMDRGREIGRKLLGNNAQDQDVKEDEFINRDFKSISLAKLDLDAVVTRILNQRIEEVKICLNGKAALSVIFLCGSTLEGVLLGIASNNPKEFNQSTVSPKDQTGKVKQFHDWTLSNFIDVAHSLDLLNEDVKKFSHALRDFRNYIHPYQQVSSKFNPDEHTAKICWQVLQAAIFQLSNKM